MPTNMPRFLACGRTGLALLATLGATCSACAQSGLGPVRLDNWGFFQKNANQSDQWQYRPRLFVPYAFESGLTFTQRADVPMLYTNADGPGNPAGGYSGGIGNTLLESIVDTPEVAPHLTLRASLRLVFPSPKASPFGNDSQYQVAPGAGFTYDMPNALDGVTIGPYVRYFWGFNAESAGTTLVSSLNVYPTVTFGLNDRWSFVTYPENPIAYNNSTNTWFVPFDFLFVNRVSKTFQFAVGGAFKLGNPSKPSYDYIVDGRATFFF